MWWPFGSADTSSTANSISSPLSPGDTLTRTEAAARIPTPIKQELSREEQASLDFAELLKEIEIEQSKSQIQRNNAKEDGRATTTPMPADISPDAIYPSEMSCRSALDYAMFCQSFGGQFVNVYRFGEFRSCKNHWSDFWLCMRTRSWNEQEKARAIQDHYRKKAIRWKTGPSSEDVWDVRTVPVKDAFQESLEDLESKIEQWKQANPDVPDPWDKRQMPSISGQLHTT